VTATELTHQATAPQIAQGEPSTTSLPDSLRLGLLAIILVAFAMRVASLDFQSLWRDEVDAIHFALRPLQETLSMITAMAQNGPFYFLSLRPWLSIVGSSEFALRLPSTFAGVAALPLLWQVGRRLAGGNGSVSGTGVPLLATLFLALNPYAFWYSQEGKMYAVITFLALAATWFWLKGIERGGWAAWVAYVLFVSFSMYTHLLMILIIPVHFIWFVIVWPSLRRQAPGRAGGYLAALAALTLPYLPMVVWQWQMLVSTEKLTGFNHTPLAEMLRTLLMNHARGFAPNDVLLLQAPVYFLALLGILLGWGELRPPPHGAQAGSSRPIVRLANAQRFLILLVWLTGPLLGIWLLSLRQPVFTDRYIIWMLPAYLLLMALGVEALRQNLGRAGTPAALLATVTLCTLWLYCIWLQSTTIIKYDLRAAVHYVSQQRTPDQLLILQIPHLEWAYRYYSSDLGTDPFAGSDERLGRWVGGLWTNDGRPDANATADVDANMRAITSGLDEAWLMLSEANMWDERRLMETWLAQNADIVDSQAFHGVQVARMRFRPPAEAGSGTP